MPRPTAAHTKARRAAAAPMAPVKHDAVAVLAATGRHSANPLSFSPPQATSWNHLLRHHLTESGVPLILDRYETQADIPQRLAH
jgi:hypothetical protein